MATGIVFNKAVRKVIIVLLSVSLVARDTIEICHV